MAGRVAGETGGERQFSSHVSCGAGHGLNEFPACCPPPSETAICDYLAAALSLHNPWRHRLHEAFLDWIFPASDRGRVPHLIHGQLLVETPNARR